MVFFGAIIALSYATIIYAEDRYAHEYSSEDADSHRENHNENRQQHSYSEQRYQQNYQQTPIQIYLAPNTLSPSRNYSAHDLQRREENSEDRRWREERREDRRWRERNEELQRQPQTPYLENQFNRDDTHW